MLAQFLVTRTMNKLRVRSHTVLDYFRIELDDNAIGRSIRPIMLNRKNALFAGSDVGASYYSSGDALIKEGDFAADLEISDDAIVWHRLRGTQRLAAGRRAG